MFSLNNLSALAGANENQGRSAPSSSNSGQGRLRQRGNSEASGLIDIRAMAAATLSSNNYGGPSGGNRGGPDMLMGADAAPVFAPVATNMLMPSAEPQGIPKWVFALVGVGASGDRRHDRVPGRLSGQTQPRRSQWSLPGRRRVRPTTGPTNSGTMAGTTTGTPATEPTTKPSTNPTGTNADDDRPDHAGDQADDERQRQHDHQAAQG